MKKTFLFIASWLPIYLISHLIGLTNLPVFADESIYIRWSQLIIDDWQQYLFFPMNDGKTPLFIWLIVASLKLISSPLLAGRVVAVLVGIIQWLAGIQIIKKLGGKQLAVLTGSVAFMFLPFWYFYHRLALMDGLLTALLSLAFLFLLKATEKKVQLKNVLLAGVFFGLSLLTKLPALLFIPSLLLAPFLVKDNKTSWATTLSWSAGTLLTGLLIFLSLKLHPAFGQLFNRGNDFLYSITELFEIGIFKILLINSQKVFASLAAYLTWPVLLLPLIGIYYQKQQKQQLLLLLATLSFLGPIMLLGKTIYPRYLLPAALPLTISAALAFEQLLLNIKQFLKKPLPLMMRLALIVLIITSTTSAILEFTLISWQNPNYLPLVSIDRQQYLEEWSSGHGILETTEYLIDQAENHTIAVATEGYFGTLPDGILMYLHNQDVTNILVEGIGQPVREIPASFSLKAQQYDQVWLVVNSHRQEMKLENTTAIKLKSFSRPNNAPSLELWDITTLVK